MATFVKNADPACDATNWNTGVESSDPSLFNPAQLDVVQWVESFQAIRVKHAILTAKHGCGFLVWNSSVHLPSGETYGYGVGRPGTFSRDVAREFVDAVRAAGIGAGFYYSTGNNFYLNALDHTVGPGPLLPGQAKVSQTEYNAVVLGHVAELWSRYGNLTEIWFDHGYGTDIRGAVQKLIAQYQPNAVGFNGEGVSNNPARWIGTETGIVPLGGTWSTASEDGAGSPTASQWLPAVCDTTLQVERTWFYVPGTPLRPLSELVDVYHRTTGNNCLLELDFAIDRTGRVHPDQVALYSALGAWIDGCYHSVDNVAAAADSPVSSSVTLQFPNGHAVVDRVVLSEDQAQGQLVRAFEVTATVNGESTLVGNGTSIGNLRILQFPNGAVNATDITFTITAHAADAATPTVSSVEFLHPCPVPDDGASPRQPATLRRGRWGQ